MKLIGYLRVSSDTQLDGYGLDTQEETIRRWIDRQEYSLVGFATDAGVSGTVEAILRPGLSEALAAIGEGRAQGLVVARLDRLARALTVQEATLAVIWRAGGQAFTTDNGRVLADDPDDPMRTALRQVVGVFAELDRRMVVKRLRDGRSTKASLGRKAVGQYAYGYAGEGKGRDRDAVPLNSEQLAVAAAVRLRAAGHSYREIAKRLDDDCLRPRRAESWSPSTVRSVILRALKVSGASDV